MVGCQMRRYARRAASQAEVLMVSRKRGLCSRRAVLKARLRACVRLCAGEVRGGAGSQPERKWTFSAARAQAMAQARAKGACVVGAGRALHLARAR